MNQSALIDCLEPQQGELFIVEGPSAAGALGRVRERRTQAILPMQGKIPNAVRTSPDRLLQHVQLADLLQSIHPQQLLELPLQQCRYQRVLLMCDPDIDGLHAFLLLVLFFYQHARELIEQNLLHMVRVPLYAIYSGTDCIAQAHNRIQLTALRKDLDSKGKPYDVKQFKGVGSLNSSMLRDCITTDSCYRQQLSVSMCKEMCTQFK